MAASVRTVFDVITDFLATSPAPEAVLEFRLPAELAQREQELATRQHVGDLTNDEESELSDFIRAEDILNLLKAKVTRTA